MNDLIFLPTILLVNMGDEASRRMVGSMSGEEIASFQEIVDVANPHHLERLDYLINEESLPFVFSAYPAAWVCLGPEFTYVKDNNTRIRRVDNIVGNCDAYNAEVDRINDSRVLAGKSTYYQWVRNRALEEMIGVITEDRMMSNSYKRRYMLERILLCPSIPAHLLGQFIACRSPEEIQLLYGRLLKDKLLVKDMQLVTEVKEEVEIDLGESIKLEIPPPRLPIPAGVKLRND